MTAQGHRHTVVGELTANYRDGYALGAEFYQSEEIYARDLERVFYDGWLYAGHISELPETGCYFLVEFGRESAMVVRDTDGGVRAFANVCRHRGSRICSKNHGKLRAFVCPYHGWTYELDGRLRSRRSMPADFDPGGYGLKPLRVEVFHGLVFINARTDGPELRADVGGMDPCLDIYQLEKTRVAHRETFTVEANWKLAVENFMECYHCAPAHPEYARSHTLRSPADNARLGNTMTRRARKLGYCVEPVDGTRVYEKTPHYYARNALYEGYLTGSEDGAQLAPFLGGITGFDGGAADIQIGETNFGLLYGDHAVLYRFVPRAVQETDMDVVWLVKDGAEAGRDYDPEKLTWLWRVTTMADKKIILDNQRGVNSRFYEPGPLSEMETFVANFYRWYFHRIGN